MAPDYARKTHKKNYNTPELEVPPQISIDREKKPEGIMQLIP